MPVNAGPEPVRLTPRPLTAAQALAVARQGAPVHVDPSVRTAMAPARAAVEDAVDTGRVVYGVTTGFGALADTRVDREGARALQLALVRSHAAGIGRLVDDEVVRAMTVLRARTLAAGCSGARSEVVDALVAGLNAGLRIAVPEHGSLGASGDLAPMAHVALTLVGEGWVADATGCAAAAGPELARLGLTPLRLEVKDGLALLNATEGMLGMLVLALADLALLAETADVACAMSLEALLGTAAPYAEDLIALRPHPGQAASAAHLRRLLDGSAILASHRHSTHAVQDAYSLRCAPQVHGAARDTLEWTATVRDRELSAVVDNPVVMVGTPDQPARVESTGNFHGQPLGFALDLLCMAAAELGAISERRIDRMLDPARSHGLPPFLAPAAGVNSGFMLAQYTAASLVAENRRLAVPASTDSIPTSGMQEDHVSLGWSAGIKLRRALDNLAGVLAVETLVAAQGIELRSGQTGARPAQKTAQAVERVRAAVPFMAVDRFLAPDLAVAVELVRSGEILQAADAGEG